MLVCVECCSREIKLFFFFFLSFFKAACLCAHLQPCCWLCFLTPLSAVNVLGRNNVRVLYLSKVTATLTLNITGKTYPKCEWGHLSSQCQRKKETEWSGGCRGECLGVS